MKDFRKLNVYDEAIDLSLELYKVTNTFPKEEIFGLTSQIKRAAVSVVANIAEGSSRFTDKDFAHFVQISIASLSELEALSDFSNKLNYLQDKSLISINNKIRKVRSMLINLNKRLRV